MINILLAIHQAGHVIGENRRVGPDPVPPYPFLPFPLSPFLPSTTPVDCKTILDIDIPRHGDWPGRRRGHYEGDPVAGSEPPAAGPLAGRCSLARPVADAPRADAPRADTRGNGGTERKRGRDRYGGAVQ